MPRKSDSPNRVTGQPQLRITMFPATSVSRPLRRARIDWLEAMPWLLGLASAAMLVLATVAWPWWSALAGHALSDYHYWQGREADRHGEAKVVVQKHWQEAVAADPAFNRARLDLARSYIDVRWYGGAIEQATAVLSQKRSRAETALAYTYRGYCQYLLGNETMGIADLELAAQFDPQNALAQSVLERLDRDGQLSRTEVEKTYRTLEGLKAVATVER